MTQIHEQNRNVARLIAPALRDKWEAAAATWGVSTSAARKRGSTSETIPMTVAQMIAALQVDLMPVETLQALLAPTGIVVVDMRSPFR